MHHRNDPPDVCDFVQREVRRCEAEHVGAARKARSNTRGSAGLLVAPIHAPSGSRTPGDIGGAIPAFSSRAYA
jgi:hypothetical protein